MVFELVYRQEPLTLLYYSNYLLQFHSSAKEEEIQTRRYAIQVFAAFCEGIFLTDTSNRFTCIDKKETGSFIKITGHY